MLLTKAVPINVSLILPFDLHGEQNCVAHRWEKWFKVAPLLFGRTRLMTNFGS